MQERKNLSLGGIVLLIVLLVWGIISATDTQPLVDTEDSPNSSDIIIYPFVDDEDEDMDEDDALYDEMDEQVESVSVEGLKGTLDSIAALEIDALDSTRQLVQTDFELKHWVKYHYTELNHEEEQPSPIRSQLQSYCNIFSKSEQAAFVRNLDALYYADSCIYETFFMEGLEFYQEKFNVNPQGYTDDDMTLCNLFLSDIKEVAGKTEYEGMFRRTSVVNDSSSFDTHRKEALYDVMEDITCINWGSAGCSLRAPKAAGALINFTADISDCSRKEIAADIEECYTALSPSQRFAFDTNLTAILYIVTEWEENPDDDKTLQSVEIEIDDSHYSAKKRSEWVAALSSLSGIRY